MVDALLRRGPMHGSDVLELYRVVLEERFNSTDGEFESSNAQLRSFLEELLTRAVVDCNGQPSADPKGNIDKLTNSGMLVRDEVEFLKGLVRLSNTNGSHPGISTSDESRFRLHVTVASARWVLALLGR